MSDHFYLSPLDQHRYRISQPVFVRISLSTFFPSNRHCLNHRWVVQIYFPSYYSCSETNEKAVLTLNRFIWCAQVNGLENPVTKNGSVSLGADVWWTAGNLAGQRNGQDNRLTVVPPGFASQFQSNGQARAMIPNKNGTVVQFSPGFQWQAKSSFGKSNQISSYWRLPNEKRCLRMSLKPCITNAPFRLVQTKTPSPLSWTVLVTLWPKNSPD